MPLLQVAQIRLRSQLSATPPRPPGEGRGEGVDSAGIPLHDYPFSLLVTSSILAGIALMAPTLSFFMMKVLLMISLVVRMM